MATWSVSIEVTDLAAKRLRIVGTRTDVDDVRTYSIQTRWDDTLTRAQNGVTFRDSIWGLYQAELARESSISTFIGAASTDLASALTALEG